MLYNVIYYKNPIYIWHLFFPMYGCATLRFIWNTLWGLLYIIKGMQDNQSCVVKEPYTIWWILVTPLTFEADRKLTTTYSIKGVSTYLISGALVPKAKSVTNKMYLSFCFFFQWETFEDLLKRKRWCWRRRPHPWRWCVRRPWDATSEETRYSWGRSWCIA